MAEGHDAYVYDEATGEWRPAGAAAAAAEPNEARVRDAAGNVLADGDPVAVIKDLKVTSSARSG